MKVFKNLTFVGCGGKMSSKRCKQSSVLVQEKECSSVSNDAVALENVEKIKAFRAVHAHFTESRKSRVPADVIDRSATPTLEIRQAMQQAKSSYDSMMDIQEKLNQAYHEIMKNPS
jgi:flagellar hook-basal body complex protein FliE